MSYFDPLALHREAILTLNEQDIVISAYPGSGHALIGNILLELGLEYFDPYTERRTLSGGVAPAKERVEYRQRLRASARRDKGVPHKPRSESGLRFLKTHLYPEEFAACNVGGIVLLIRDPRDTLYSYYRWRLGFSEEGENGNFAEFLKRPGINGLSPCMDWATFHICWLKRIAGEPKSLLLSFEHLKRNGKVEMGRLLNLIDAEISDERLERALIASSFQTMRAHEDAIVNAKASHRIMRRGLVGEWKEWFGPEYQSFFSLPAMVDTARYLGYDLEIPPNCEHAT